MSDSIGNVLLIGKEFSKQVKREIERTALSRPVSTGNLPSSVEKRGWVAIMVIPGTTAVATYMLKYIYKEIILTRKELSIQNVSES